MRLFGWVRQRMHPLHSLRKFQFYQKLPRYFDPLVRRRLPDLPRPIYLRLFSHASLILDSTTQEHSIRETFCRVISALPRHNAVFWDVGANIGWYSWLCAAFRPECAIVSFDPDQKNLECLRRTNEAWNLQNQIIVSCAVAEKSGSATFYLDEVTGATGTLEQQEIFTTTHYGAAPRTIETETISLDDFARDHQPPSIIKLDIEGTELSALRGGARLIERYQPILFLETFCQRREIFSYLTKSDYRLFDSERRGDVDHQTINLIAFVQDRFPSVAKDLLEMGYPIECPHESIRA